MAILRVAVLHRIHCKMINLDVLHCSILDLYIGSTLKAKNEGLIVC